MSSYTYQTSDSPLEDKLPMSNLNPTESKAVGDVEESSITPRPNTLARGFKSRHVGMFAIAGAIGTGLLIGSGTGLARGGPGSMLIAYAIMGFLVLNVMSALGEMSVYMPMDKGFSGYAARLVDPALGFATGVNYFFKYVVLLANNLTASGIIMQYWLPGINVGVWVVSFGIPIIAMNCLSAKRFGEIEFWAAIIKTIVIVSLILICIIIASGGTGDRLGFRYWEDPGAFQTYFVKGKIGRFLGFWACITNAAFAFMGAEMVGITFGEAERPWHTIPKALSATFWRIFFFYIGGVWMIGMCISSTSSGLINATKTKTGADASPFVLAIKNAGIPVLPDIINGALLVFVLSAANTDIYLASRTLYGLAKDNYMPKVFCRLYNHLSYPAIAVSSLFFLIAFMNISSSSAAVFKYLVSLSTVLGLINWVNILVPYLFFVRAMRAQNISRETLPYRGPFQEMRAWFTLIFTCIIILTQGFAAFVGKFNVASFITSYLGVALYLLLIAGWKLGKRSHFVGFKGMDITTDITTKLDALAFEAEDPSSKKMVYFRSGARMAKLQSLKA